MKYTYQCCYIKMRLLAGWKRISPGHSKAVWSAGPVCSAVSPLCHYTMTFALYSCLHLLAQTCTGPYRKQTLLTINPSADVTSFNIINQTSFNLQVVVVITVPLSYRICECLVPYFDSRSSGSCNVSLLSGCVFFFFFTLRTLYVMTVFWLHPQTLPESSCLTHY